MAFNWRRFLGLGEESQDREGRSHGSQEPPPTSTGRVYKPGEWIGGEYRVLDVFQGGMGSVYVVSHDELSYPIVLKTLQETNDPNSIRAFRREAETWVNVGFHQNVVKAHYFRFIDGLPFVAAEYIAPDPNGHNSLSDYVGIEVNESILLRWCAQFCNGMTHAQSHGVIAHRDVKPANLMLDSLGTLKIADFGLARSISLPSGTIEEQSEQATIAGTLPYMAPEQLHSPDQLDQRVDIYAIGVVLYQLLSGAFPFEVTSQERIVQGILRGIPSPLSSQLWPICKRCLAKDRNDRFQTFTSLLEATRAVADHMGVAIPTQPREVDEGAESLFAKVLSYRELGRDDLAMRYATQFVSTFPSDNRGWMELGVLHLKSGDANRAHEATSKSLSLDSFCSQSWNNLGVALSRLGKHEEAVNALKSAVSHDPLNTGAMLNQCTPLLKLRRPIEAIKVLERAASLSPEKASIWANLGAVKMELGELGDAERCFKRALSLHPGLKEVEANLESLRQRRNSKNESPDAAALLAKGHNRQAEQLLLERVAVNPDDIDAWHNLGIVALQDRREAEAIKCFRKVAELDSKEEFATSQLVTLHASRGEFDSAIAYCDRLARIPGMEVKEAALRAQILQACGRADEAISRLSSLVQRDPDLDTIWFMLSEIYEREGRLEDSLQAAEVCLKVLLRVGGNRDNIDNVRQRIVALRQAVE